MVSRWKSLPEYAHTDRSCIRGEYFLGKLFGDMRSNAVVIGSWLFGTRQVQSG